MTDPTSDEPAGDHPDQGRVARLSARADHLRHQATEQAEALEERVPHLSLLRELWDRYNRQNATVLAGHLAFRMFLFVLPLVVVVVALLGFSTPEDVEDVSTQRFGLSRSISQSIADGARQAHTARWALAMGGISALVLTGLSLLKALHYCFAQAWGMEAGKLRRRASLLARFVGATVVLVATVMAAGALRKVGLIAGLSGVLASATVITIAMVGVGIVMPRRATAWVWLLPGSIGAAVASVGLQAFATFYLPDKLSRSSSLYGSLGVSVAVLFYLFLVGNIVVGSALVNAVWWDHFHGPATTPGELRRLPEPPVGDVEGSVEDHHVVIDAGSGE
jgi:uncharacterized BrkB/YihY/UPF0761 family membrane protein